MATGRITIINNSADGNALQVAVYQKPSPNSQWPIVAWRVNSPQIGTPAYVPTSDEYATYVGYQYNGLSYATTPLPITNLMGSYQVSKGALLIEMHKTSAGSQPNIVEIYVQPQTGQTVLANITLDSHVAYPPQNVPQGVTMSYLISDAFYIAFVAASVNMGDVLDHSLVAPSEIPINSGQTAYISGSASAGYSIVSQ